MNQKIMTSFLNKLVMSLITSNGARGSWCYHSGAHNLMRVDGLHDASHGWDNGDQAIRGGARTTSDTTPAIITLTASVLKTSKIVWYRHECIYLNLINTNSMICLTVLVLFNGYLTRGLNKLSLSFFAFEFLERIYTDGNALPFQSCGCARHRPT